MRSEVASDLKKSAETFLRLVWPAIKRATRGGRLLPVESAQARELDILAGVDAWQLCDELGAMRGIASRVQWCERSYDTFTVRFRRPHNTKTEYEKRLLSMKDKRSNWLFPVLTVQAYITPENDRLLSAAVVYTTDLYAHIERFGPMTYTEKQNYDRSSTFLVIPWSGLQWDGVKLAIVRGDGESR